MPDEQIDDAIDPGSPPPAGDKDYQAEINELREQLLESQRTAQFWADKAQAIAPPAPAPAPAAGDEEPDVLEAITTRGAKGFDDLAEKRGFVRKTEVEGMIDAKAAALTKEQNLMNEYPDLKIKSSDFFKATAVHYGALVKQGVPGVTAMELAARQTELDFLRAGKTPPAPADEKEARRLARVNAQSGGNSGGRRPAAPPVGGDEDDNELTAEQKHIADAMGISHEAYAKRAKAGVAIGGRGR
jgi:hypothetical protein